MYSFHPILMEVVHTLNGSSVRAARDWLVTCQAVKSNTDDLVFFFF